MQVFTFGICTVNMIYRKPLALYTPVFPVTCVVKLWCYNLQKRFGIIYNLLITISMSYNVQNTFWHYIQSCALIGITKKIYWLPLVLDTICSKTHGYTYNPFVNSWPYVKSAACLSFYMTYLCLKWNRHQTIGFICKLLLTFGINKICNQTLCIVLCTTYKLAVTFAVLYGVYFFSHWSYTPYHASFDKFWVKTYVLGWSPVYHRALQPDPIWTYMMQTSDNSLWSDFYTAINMVLVFPSWKIYWVGLESQGMSFVYNIAYNVVHIFSLTNNMVLTICFANNDNGHFHLFLQKHDHPFI